VKNFTREYSNFIEEGGQDEEFNINRKKHCCHSNAHSKDLVERVQELINEDPGRSMRKLAEDLEVSEFLNRKIDKEDICYK
jgi:hypothetical protein